MSTESKDELEPSVPTPPEPKAPIPEDEVQPEAKGEDLNPPPALRSFPDYPE